MTTERDLIQQPANALKVLQKEAVTTIPINCRALCIELLDKYDLEWRARERLKEVLAQPEPEGPSDRIISIAMAAQECAFAWEPTARMIGNVCAEDIADLCGAVLARWGSPAVEPEINGQT